MTYSCYNLTTLQGKVQRNYQKVSDEKIIDLRSKAMKVKVALKSFQRVNCSVWQGIMFCNISSIW